MNFQSAKILLESCERNELRDHAFGDVEVVWTRGGFEVATGYFSENDTSVNMTDDAIFLGEAALELLKCGTPGQVDRNDETGPDDFVMGRTMPGLTREGVKDELIRHNIFDESNKEKG